MKFILLLFYITTLVLILYFVIKNKKLKPKKRNILIKILAGVITISVALTAAGMYLSTLPNKQCLTSHKTTTQKPVNLKTAEDYFEMGNYNYDIGSCVAAIGNYSNAIKLNPKFAEAYNNRAYTYMMMADYKNTLTSLDKAIEIRPTYVHALMNRGDIHNYYLIDRVKAVADYDRVIAIGSQVVRETSVCGHRLMAVNNHNLFKTFYAILLNNIGMQNVPGCSKI
jgi:tetratricopeptide (TPR) repeat protein